MSSNPQSTSMRLARWLRAARQSRVGAAALVIVVIVPTLLSAIYMWILWDPTNYLRQMPVAVASDDIGSSLGGHPHKFSADILDTLTSSRQLQFHRVSSAEAIEGLRQNRYTFSVVFPPDFTTDIESVTDPKPVRARIMVYNNGFNGILGQSVAELVLAQAQQQITASIGKEYASQVLVGVNSLGAGLEDASKGTRELAGGTQQLEEGSGQLAAGLDQAASGSVELQGGTKQLHSGAEQLASGNAQLLTGTDQLGAGAVQIRDGVAQAVNPILDALTPAGRMATTLAPLLDHLASSSDPALSDAASQLRTLIDQVRQANPDGLAGQLAQLRDGTSELARQLTDPQADYRAGVLALVTGSAQVRDGSGQLDTGMTQLATGLQQLSSGGHQLRDGIGQLDDGVGQLDSGLRAGASQAPHIDDVNASADMFSQPFSLDVHDQEPGQVLVDGDPEHKKLAGGSGPLIVILATFLTVIVIWMLVNPLERRSHETGWRAAVRAVRRRMWIGVIVGIAAALLASAYGASVGWSPQDWTAMACVVMFGGAVAGAVSYAFVAAFGRVAGSAAAFAFFMFQIFAFGGVFPVGTTPWAFRGFKDIAPMTFVRRAIIRCDIELYDRMFWISVVILLAMSAIAFGISVCAQFLRASTTAPVDSRTGDNMGIGNRKSQPA